ncbi:MAG TPA: glycosyltransferase family 4 protein [Polyangiaceae bacterium]|nr:glycosyltransferase family 4 protein [Polyangiaceae bacterium]
MKRMRVLFVSPAAELGGAERCLLDCIAALHEHERIQVDVVALADGPLLEKARALGAAAQVVQAPRKLTLLGESGSGSDFKNALFALSSAGPEVARFLARLREAIAGTCPDVVHTNGMKAHLLAGLVAPAHARLVVHLHDFIGARRTSKWLLPALRRIRPRTVFIANSRAVAQDFARLAPKAEIRTIYNVVDTNYFHDGPAEPGWLANLAGLRPPAANTTTFGLVATYARWKGHGLFIEAAGLLKKARPDVPVQIYVVGGPIYETVGSQVQPGELLQQARTAGLEPDFGLIPFQDDIARVYRALNVIVHASTQPEPFGRTIVEAMACARPVIVARAGGAAELFEEGANAFGFEPGNAAQLAEAMIRELDPNLRTRLGSAAREHARVHFDRSRLGPELLAVYTP